MPRGGAKGPHLIFNLFIYQFFIIYCFCCGFDFDVLNLKGPAGGCEGLSLQFSVLCDEAHREILFQADLYSIFTALSDATLSDRGG